MSFLNPVSEPVKRFSSSDISAPQINYNVRVAGDVKAVLKACLVTGYGAKASAGWSITNDTDNVAEFISPSTSMSDYKLGIDDASASSTTWYYQYQGARVNPTNNSCKKSFTFMTKTSPENGWELITTERGLFFIEKMFNPDVSSTVARLTYFGRVKSASVANTGENIGFWCVGHGASFTPQQLFSTNTNTHFNVNGNSLLNFVSANINGLSVGSKTYKNIAVDLTSTIYLYKDDTLVAEHPGILAVDPASKTNIYGIRDVINNSRPFVYVCLGRETSLSNLDPAVRVVLIYLDYWDY